MDMQTQSPLVRLIDTIITKTIEYRKQVLIGTTFALCLSGAVVGYNFYKRNVQIKAHENFISALKYYEAPVKATRDETDFSTLQFTNDAEKWAKVEEVFRNAYENYKNAGIAPTFLIYQSEALMNLGKHEEAIAALQKSIALMDNSSAADFFSVKLALMQLDSKQAATKEQGFALLKKIAESQQSVAQESALYYLGGYFWSQKKYPEAQNYWKQLLLKFDNNNPKVPSIYAEQIKIKLSLINPE
jgi:tetratricopeptide (TPR) repeat protein